MRQLGRNVCNIHVTLMWGETRGRDRRLPAQERSDPDRVLDMVEALMTEMGEPGIPWMDRCLRAPVHKS